MPVLKAFGTPALQQDLQDPAQQQALNELWSANVTAFTLQAIAGNPWTQTNSADQVAYYNPLVTDVKLGTEAKLVSWSAFPNRLNQYLGAGASPTNPYGLTQPALWAVADTGSGLKPIPQSPCADPLWGGPTEPYGPYGPRGWQDEYCEWSVIRNAQSKITRVDFACENPEYWYSLWRIDPQAAAYIYTQTLNYQAPAGQQIQVTVADLQLVDPSSGQPVIDPSTGRPAYNPLNRWNCGPVSIRTGLAGSTGGVMHLTATPNTLQTELGLAGGATVLRTQGNTNPQDLICCSVYGQNFRNSDPHIGQTVNLVVAGGAFTAPPPPGGNIVSLANPPGLYIQMPDFSQYALPDDPKLPPGAQPSDCWQVVRGRQSLPDPVTGTDYPGNFILHAVFQLPPAWIEAGVAFTVGDITIGGIPIQFGAQIVETISMGLYARPVSAPASTPEPCVGFTTTYPQPLQLMPANLWSAYYGTEVTNPVGVPMNLASNTVIVPAFVPQGAQGVQLALTCSGVTAAPVVSFPPGSGGGADISVATTPPSDVTYAVPGNSFPGPAQVVTLTLDVAATAELGLRSIVLANPNQSAGPPAPAFLCVVSAAPSN